MSRNKQVKENEEEAKTEKRTRKTWDEETEGKGRLKKCPLHQNKRCM